MYSQLKTHKKQTHEGGSKCRLLTCEDCEEKFKNSQALLMHRLKAHGKGKLFSCEDCSFKSPRKKDLQGIVTLIQCYFDYRTNQV